MARRFAPSQLSPALQWRGFALTLTGVTAGLALIALGAILWLDPYGVFATPGARPGPIMDINQRYMYPQIVRSRRFDSAVLGTSTMRLLNPADLDRDMGGHFANLAMNAATPWEQMQLAGLFLRKTQSPRFVVWGLDRNWCDADADSPAKRLTFRSFPPWLYDDARWNDIAPQFNLQTLQIALRVAAYKLGLMPERIARDGYEVFTPPEATYDLERARGHIWDARPRHVTPQVPAAPPPSPQDIAAMRFPAFDELDALLASAPTETRLVFVFPPIHVAAQAQPGSEELWRDEACKARAVAVAARHQATIIDFRLPSPVTTDDSRYWDRLHYRLDVARQVVSSLSEVVHKHSAAGTRAAIDGFYRVLRRTSAGEG